MWTQREAAEQFAVPMRRLRVTAMCVFAVVSTASLAVSNADAAQALTPCHNDIDHARWVHLPSGWTLAVTPSRCGIVAAHTDPSLVLDQAVITATPPAGKPRGWNPAPHSLAEQLECHAWFVPVVEPDKTSWNLEIWRPVVPWAIEILDLCNPPRAK